MTIPIFWQGFLACLGCFVVLALIAFGIFWWGMSGFEGG